MEQENYRISLVSDNDGDKNRQAKYLTDFLRDLEGVEEIKRVKEDNTTMDLGSTVSVIVASGAAAALCQGLADWLRARRGTKLTIERNADSKSLKAIIEGIDPDSAKDIVETLTAT